MSDRSLDQERAAFAWKATEGKVTTDFVNLASGAPALVMSNGLMQALAFYRDKDKDHHRALLEAVLRWLGREAGPIAGSTSFDAAMKALHGSDPDTYIRATEEALEVLKWIRQIAKARRSEG